MLSGVKRTVARTAVHTVGRTSRGVRIGFRHGFGSSMLDDHVCAGEARGTLGIGRIVDRAFLDAPEQQAVRARSELVQQMLREEIAVRGGEVRVLDIAAGSGRCLQEVLAEDEPGGQLRVVCRDPEPAALSQGLRMVRQRRLTEDSLSYERGDALDPAPLPDGLVPDLVVASGLYEQLADDDTFSESLTRLRAMLAPDGALLFSTRTSRPRGLLAAALPHRFRDVQERACRPVADAEAWAVKAGFAAEGITSRSEVNGVFALTRCRNR